MANISKIKTLDGTVYTISDSNAVHKTGDETVAGIKTFSSTVTHENNGQVGFSTKITGNATLRDYVIKDSNDYRISLLRGKLISNGSRETQLVAIGGSSLNTFSTITVGITASGETYATAPSTSSTGSSTTIVTKDYADAIDTNAVHKNVDEEINSDKTFLKNKQLHFTSPLNLSDVESTVDRVIFDVWKDPDTISHGNVCQLQIAKSANVQDYRAVLRVSNPRANVLPTAESIANGIDDSDASTNSCWGGIGIWYDYSKNRAYPYCNTSEYSVTDNQQGHIPTTYWVRHATGNFACNAATATQATQDENGRNIASGYMWKESYERIAGTSTEHKDLNDYTSAGFYNIATQYVDNVPVGIGAYAVLLVYPWKPSSGDGTKYSSQEITEAFSSTQCRRWIRKQNNGIWSEWKQIAFATSWSSTKLYDVTLAEAATATSTNPYTLTTTEFGAGYKELFIRLEVSTAQPTAATLRFKIVFSNTLGNNHTLKLQSGNGISTSASNYVCIRAGNYDCLLFGSACRSTGNPSIGAWYSMNGSISTHMPQFADIDDTVTKIEIWSTSSTVTQLPSGMNIMIWGRK